MTAGEDFAAQLRAAIGDQWVSEGEAIGDRYRSGNAVARKAAPGWLAKPTSTAEVSAVMRLAHARRIPVTVIGGQSGTCGAAVPSDGGLALSLERMNRIVEIDPLSLTLTVEPGCLVQVAQETVETEGLFLPLDLGSRGSAMIGGVIGTNAGGNRVIRWGMMRDMVLGLEVVLADGTVLSSLTKMLKDNAGYAWKQLMIGSEGTLGVVTRAVLRLRPLPPVRMTALVAFPGFEAAITVLRRLETTLGGQVTSFELMWEDFYRLHTEAQIAQRPRPLPLGRPIYGLIETMGADEPLMAGQLEQGLAALVEEALVADAVIAQSARERDALWAIREDTVPGHRALRPLVGYDVSMAISDMPRFVATAREALLARYPDATMLFCGHAGDGNLHIICSVGRLDEDVKHGFDAAIYGAVREVGGSIAAEHGIGTTRMGWLDHTRSPEELALMRTIRRALDPEGILNPGKLFAME